MHPTRHILFSGLLFFIWYVLGLSKELAVVGFLASVLIDIDHFALGGVAGSYNPAKIYNYCINAEILKVKTKKELLKGKILGSWLFPLHNIWVACAFLLLWPPASLGIMFHLLLDEYEIFLLNY